jgi:ribosome-binding protein aMBF1 (putative translation factor)
MEHQDWKPVVFGSASKTAIKSPDKQQAYKAMSRRTHDQSVQAKLAMDTQSTGAPEPIQRDLSSKIRDARNQKRLTQKQLAQLISEKEDIIKNYEAGKAIPQPQILNKIQRALQVKF